MKKSELTQKKIINAAENLFMTQTIDRVSVASIAEKAGVAKGTFYLYFETKDDVVWAVIEKYLHVFTDVFNQLDYSNVGFDVIDQVIDALFDFILSHKKEMYLFHQASFLGYLGKDRIEVKYVDVWEEPIRLWIQKGVENEVFHTDHAAFSVQFILASFHGIIDDYITEKSSFSAETIQVELKQIIRKLLG